MEFFYTGETGCWRCKTRFDRQTADICPECNWNYCPSCGACSGVKCKSNQQRIDYFRVAAEKEFARRSYYEKADVLKQYVRDGLLLFHGEPVQEYIFKGSSHIVIGGTEYDLVVAFDCGTFRLK